MAIRIKARSGESAEQMLRRFKKLCEKEGLTKDVKRQAYYEKPSERRRRAMRKAIKRAQQLAGLLPMPVRGKFAGRGPAGAGGPPPRGGRGGRPTGGALGRPPGGRGGPRR
ncbi:MAG: 30S ribosomal protein S21 [Phycisphaeraceae bacterium]